MSVSRKLLTAAVLFIVVVVPAASYAGSTGEFSNNELGSLAGTNTGLTLSGVILTKGSGVHPTADFAGTLGESAIVTTRLMTKDDIGYPNGSPAMAGGKPWTSSIPEPSTLALFGTGLLTLGGAVRRKRV